MKIHNSFFDGQNSIDANSLQFYGFPKDDRLVLGKAEVKRRDATSERYYT